MASFFRRHRSDELESELRRGRVEPSRELADRVTRTVHGQPERRWRPLRLGFVAALTAALLVALAATVGFGRASSSAVNAASAVKHLVVVSHTQTAKPNGSDNDNNGDEKKAGGNDGDDDHNADDTSGRNQYSHRVLMCHHTKHHDVTISVDIHAVPAHLRHGDTLGPCR